MAHTIGIVPKTMSVKRRRVVIGLRQIVIILYRRRIRHVKWKVNVLLYRKKQKSVNVVEFYIVDNPFASMTTTTTIMVGQ